ncbi:MAG: hypothetical protein HYX37_01775 [Rhizobiales bacterium]|nr:hypothetical protein [Hyphomicrobiales bacterium]
MLLALDRLGATYTAASLPATPRLPRRSVDFENEGSVAHDPEKWEPVFG